MKITVARHELKILAALAVVLACFLGYSHMNSGNMQEELEALGQQRIADYLGDANPEDYESLVMAEGGRAFKYFGRAWGIVHIYIRDAGDEEMKTFKGIEYYYKRIDGRWVEIDSAGCGALSHHVKAFKEFENRGMKVSPSVYARLNQR